MVKALILINTDSGMENKVSEEIVRMNFVKEVHIVYGVYDVIVELEVNSYEELRKAVSMIRSVSHVRSTTTLIIVK